MFNWIAAGSSYTAFGGICIYVRHRTRVGEYEEIPTPAGFFIKLKDRELFITRPGMRDYNIPLTFRNWDYCIDAEMLGFGSAVKNTGIMFCYENKASKRNFRYDKSQAKAPIFGDSGGYKLSVGTEDWIDPKDLATWYNQYVTRGMTLDIPPYSGSSDEQIHNSAVQQKANTQVIFDNLDPSVMLYNVCHGFTIENRRRFIDTVYDDRLTHWALGSTYYGNIFDFLSSVMSSIEFIGQQSYHVFGVAGVKIIPILAWLGKYYDITSDSSSHLQSGRCTTAFSMQGYLLKKLGVGRARRESLQTSNMHPYNTCSCNICHALQTTEIFYYGSSNVNAYLLALHNINTMARYAQLWSSLSVESDLKTYKAALSKILPAKEVKSWHHALDYIEACRALGVAAATRKFHAYISVFMSLGMSSASARMNWLDPEEQEAFNSAVSENAVDSREAASVDASTVVDDEEKVTDRFDRILMTYDTYHKSNHTQVGANKKKSKDKKSKEVKHSIGIKGASLSRKKKPVLRKKPAAKKA
jgi:hypothetical protein